MSLELLNACRDSMGFLSYPLCPFLIACFLPSSWFNMEIGNLFVLFCFNIRESPGSNLTCISRRKGAKPSPHDLFLRCCARWWCCRHEDHWWPSVLHPGVSGAWMVTRTSPKVISSGHRMGASGCLCGRWLDWPHPVADALYATIAVDFFAIEPRLLDRDPAS